MTKTFTNEGTFKAYYAATKWLKEEGYSYGSMANVNPIGIMKGDWDIAKWYNLSTTDKELLDGTITGDMREGPVTITIELKD